VRLDGYNYNGSKNGDAMKAMKNALAWVASGSLVLLSAGGAAAQTTNSVSGDSTLGSAPIQLPMVGPATASAAPAPPPPPQAQVPVQAEPAAPAVDPAAQAANGQWAYTTQFGWVWVPSGAESTSLNQEPYVYLYAPSYGWAWFASPWGRGPFHYGPWATYFGPRFWGGSYHYGVGGWGYYGRGGWVGAHGAG
jgi:hypothetical protein